MRLLALALVLSSCAHVLPRTGSPVAECDLPPCSWRAVDVDLDGLIDRVCDFPQLDEASVEARFEALPPAVVAHAQRDGRFAFDAPVARAALRALCPEAPPVRVWGAETPVSDAATREPFVEALLLDGFCRRVWGDSVDAAVAHVQASIAASDPSIFAEEAPRGLAAAVAHLFVPRPLGPLAAPAWPVWPPRPEPKLEEPELEPGPSTPGCAATVAAWDALDHAVAELNTRSTHENKDEDAVVDRPAPVCAETPAGLWTLTPGAPTASPDVAADYPTAHVAGTLSWRPALGPPASRELPWFFNWHSRSVHAIAAVADLDGDGLPEVLLRHLEDYFEGLHPRSIEVLSVRDGRIVPYPLAPPAHWGPRIGVRDVDHDGRPDLLGDSPWRVTDRCGHMGIDHTGPLPAARARPDGRFALDDDATRAWLLAQCFAPEGTDDPDLPLDVIDIACARLAGLDPEAIVAALHARMRPIGPQRHLGSPVDRRCLTFQELAAQSLLAPFAARGSPPE